MKLPEIGDKIYIPGSYYISRGEDDVDGGLATISKVEVSDYLPLEHHNSIMVQFERIPGHSYNYKYLLERQEELSKEYENEIAKPNPDINTPWIQQGDIVNGQVYRGSDIW